MADLNDLLKKHGVTPMENPSSGPRSKLLNQVNRMLKEMENYDSAADLDGDNARFWWAPQSVDGKRKITPKYGNRAVEGMGTYVDNNLEAVKSVLQAYKAIIEESTDDTWAAEEARRNA